MFSSREVAGKWNDVDCATLRSYICEIKAESQYPEPVIFIVYNFGSYNSGSYQEPDWPKCGSASLGEKGFVNFRDSCYLSAKEAKTFSEAEQYCKEQGEDVHLVSIQDIAEEDFTIVYSFPDNIWIGLSKADVDGDGDVNTWSWSDGWPVTYTNWFNNDLNNETCASLHNRETKWFQANCDETYQSVCKWTNASKPSPPPPSPCPDDWEDIGGEKCYKFKLDSYAYVSSIGI